MPERDLLTRRDVLTIGVGLAAIPIVGCTPDAAVPIDASAPPDDAPSIDAAIPEDAPIAIDAPPAEDAPPAIDASEDGGPPEGPWASGGTVAMTDVASYPDPFAGAPGVPCAATITTTLGPCHFTTPVRRDVSEGYPGLPVRLELRVVDAACAPIEGARVEIWHPGISGHYSGGPSRTCTDDDPDALAHLYFRGGQITGADGRVAFHTCVPGWYRGRAVHIHVQVFLPDGMRASVVSQLFFRQRTLTEIFTTHPDYVAYGLPDVPNESDGIYRAVGEAGIVEHARMTDGAMLAWKQIALG